MSKRTEEHGYIALKRSGKDKLSNHIELKNDNWSVGSKKKLKASMRHKIKKTFVSILDILDKEREEGNIPNGVFKRLRSKILNIGNDQIRHMEVELDARYNIEFVNYHLELKVVDGTENNDEVS